MSSACALKALLWMLTSAIGFAFMNVCAKEASRGLSFFEISLARSAVGAIFLLLLAKIRAVPLVINNRRILALRAGAGTLAIFFHFYSITTFPFAEVTALLNLTPMLVAALAAVWLKEKITPGIGFFLALAMVGVLFIARPTGGSAMGTQSLIALGAPLMSAIAMVSLRRLGESESAEAIVVYFFSIAAVLQLLVSVVFHSFVTPVLRTPNLNESLLMIGTGVCAAIAQLTMTKAYAVDQAARVGGLNYLNIVASVVLGIVIFGEMPDLFSWIGIFIILISGAGLMLSGRIGRASSLSL